MNASYLIVGLALAGVLLIGSSGKAKSNKPLQQSPKQKEITEALFDLELLFGINGLKDAFSAFIQIESKWVPSATSSPAGGYNLLENNLGKFYANPWKDDPSLWQSTTGILQLFPLNALNTSDGVAVNWDPQLNYDWRYALVFGLDFAYRLNSKYPDAQTWGDIRRAWSSLKDLYNPNSSHSMDVLGRFLKGLDNTGGSQDTVYIKPNFSKYKQMGFKATLDYILGKYSM